MKHILMVDDVATNLKIAAEVLEPYYKLSMAKSGKQALRFLEKNVPDLILLDIMMPEMDGYQTMEEIKLDPKTANIPIIFLTADKEHESEVKGIKMGAMDFITKPFDAEVMLGRIQQVLHMDEMRKNLLNPEQNNEIQFNIAGDFDLNIENRNQESRNPVQILNYQDFMNEIRTFVTNSTANAFIVSELKDDLKNDISKLFYRYFNEDIISGKFEKKTDAIVVRHFEQRKFDAIINDISFSKPDIVMGVVLFNDKMIESIDTINELYLCADKAYYHAYQSKIVVHYYEPIKA